MGAACHNARMKICLALLLCVAGAAMADSVTISGSVLDVDGQPLAGAVVALAGVETESDRSGRYQVVAPRRDVYQLQITADGFYAIVHGLTRADVSNSNVAQSKIKVAPITLVERKPGRQLLVFAGDTMMGRRFVTPPDGEPVLIEADTAATDMRAVLQHVKPYLELADFASVNLETQLASSEPVLTLPKSVTFYTFPQIAAALKWAGVDYVALGNNHTFDYLDAGLQQTLDALNSAGLAYSGAGTEEVSARAPYVAAVDGQRVDLLSYVGWPGTFAPSQVAETDKGGAAYGTADNIAADLEQIPSASLAVVQYHSGLEYVSTPPLAEETQLKLAIDRGADLAIGHHSHVLQGFEVYRHKLIAYSLGNFVFDQYLYATQASMLLFVWYDEDHFYRAEVVPLHINGYVPTPASGQIRTDILQRLARLSDTGSVCWFPSGAHASFTACKPGQTASAPQDLTLPDNMDENAVVALSSLQTDSLRPVRTVHVPGRFRLGLDILRRGDFEHTGLYGTQDRSWILGEQVAVVDGDSVLMRMTIPENGVVATGMKVFTRVFTRSAPASVTGRVRSNGCANVEFSLQRRPDGMSFTDALANGPITELGQLSADANDWLDFEIGFKLPRTFTRAVRLLIRGRNCGADGIPVELELDDLALLEWQTPWYAGGETIRKFEKSQATHLQYRRHSQRL